jgi:hypothetical protein
MLYAHDKKLIGTMRAEWQDRAKKAYTIKTRCENLKAQIDEKKERSQEIRDEIKHAEIKMAHIEEEFNKKTSYDDQDISADQLQALTHKVQHLRETDQVTATYAFDHDAADAWSLAFSTKQDNQKELAQIEKELNFTKRQEIRILRQNVQHQQLSAVVGWGKP